MTKLEEVARAIAECDTGCYLNETQLANAARAAVGALREPNEHQYNALAATDKMWRDMNSEFVWRTYIDAILSEKPDL